MKILWIFFFFLGGEGHYKFGLYLGVVSMHFRVFSQGQGKERRIFLGVAKISNIKYLFEVLEIPDIFGG